jgi:osmotically-inducible protein OsmY
MRKTNSDLHKDVLDELAFDPSVDERNIGIAVHDGAVTLTGTVPSYTQKIAAEKSVKRVGGVLGIVEELQIDLPALHRRDDADLVMAALDALAWNSSVPKDGVVVKAERGWLTLSGTVDWQFQREAARNAISALAGVRGVTDEIGLSRRVAAGDVMSKIRESFRRHSEIDAAKIGIETGDGTVTLSGAVHSWTERDEAASAAFSIPGVIRVKNLTTIA